jgi:hypothetical protein
MTTRAMQWSFVSQLSATLGLGGLLCACASSRLLKNPLPATAADLGWTVSAPEGLTIEVDQLIVRNSGGSWVRDANWDEYASSGDFASRRRSFPICKSERACFSPSRRPRLVLSYFTYPASPPGGLRLAARVRDILTLQMPQRSRKPLTLRDHCGSVTTGTTQTFVA